MEYQYIDIEAHIRNAHKLRSEALSEILSSAWKKTVRGFKRLTNRQLHAHIVAARASASAIY
jgi:hypothetical protein